MIKPEDAIPSFTLLSIYFYMYLKLNRCNKIRTFIAQKFNGKDLHKSNFQQRVIVDLPTKYKDKFGILTIEVKEKNYPTENLFHLLQFPELSFY